MQIQDTDPELVGAYAREGSETAFRALVSRHVDLVFATALRQVGDRGMAEEITQNTFVALARKAPRLAGHTTLAGWLHRTALLEAKARIRTELRRRRREQRAADWTPPTPPGSSGADDLTPLLDEALLGVGETDRTAVVLRYLEGHSLGEVGRALGISEEAARKRVDRAVSRLAGFFQARGFTVAGTATATALAQAAVAAPPGLAASAAGAALAAGKVGGPTALLIARLATLTPAQAVVTGALLAVLPLAWSRQTVRAETSRLNTLEARLGEEREALATLRQARDRQVDDLDRMQARLDALRASTAVVGTGGPAAPPRPPYAWDDASPVLRVPKSLVRSLDLFGVRNHRGDLSEMIITALQLNPSEIAAVEESLRRFLSGYHAAESRGAVPLPATADSRSFLLPDTRAEVAALRGTLLQSIAAILPGERSALLLHSLRDWMPLDDEYRGLNTGAGVMATARRVTFTPRPAQPHVPGAAVLGWSVEVEGSGSIHATLGVDDIPPHLQPHLQDWIDAARAANDQPAPIPEEQP